MDKNLRDIVLSIAQDVRYWAEARADRFSKDLNGLCAIASAELHRRLKLNGIHSDIHMANDGGGSHVFLVIDDHILDVTATQFKEFRNVQIVLDHIRLLCEHEFYITDKVFTTAEELRIAQKKTGWPGTQIAYAKISRSKV